MGVGVRRDGSLPLKVTAVPGDDIVGLQIQDGPMLFLHPETARDLLTGPNWSETARSGTGDDSVPVQPELAWPGADSSAATRDLSDIGHVVISGFQVLTGLRTDKTVDFAASQVVKNVDGQVEPGVYTLEPGRLDKLKGSGRKPQQIPKTAEPVLVLLHGTFVDTESTFQKLWSEHSDGVAKLFERYAGRVYALDHPTLGVSPIANARTLVDALPAGARLHLMTHSRGGLVAEVLARVAGQRGKLAPSDLAFFAAPDYAGQQRELRELAAIVADKGIAVDRLVRVACPVRGTLLASRRLDAYVSVLKWGLEAVGLTILPAFVDFLGEVARRRANPAEIPGLAAMMPETPLVEWLNGAPPTIPGDLRVVAGDLQRGNTLGSWLKALLADAYYWTDNDIVVQTRSMYAGAPRSAGASFLLDQGSGVTHFSYFSNEKTADAVISALVDTEPPAGFKPIGPLSWAGEDATGERGLTRSAPDPAKPAVIILPGIVGSNLKQGVPPDDDRIWLSVRLIGGFDRLAYQPDGADNVAEDGPVGRVYDSLAAYLDATHEVIPFGYDWRRPMQEEASRLAARVRQALDARKATDQPVRILAHSMGGLLARTLHIVEPATWQRLMEHRDARLLMLGTPNGGSWAPMQVLSGDDTFGNALAAIGSPFATRKARMLMAQMPGFLQLQAGLLDKTLGLDSSATWQKLADDDCAREQQKNWWHRYAGELASAMYAWGVPPQGVLDQAQELRKALNAQITDGIGDSAERILLVVGHAKSTPDGFEVGNDGFVYLEAQDGGDGRVPLELALMPGVKTWTLDCEHGNLPSAKNAFDAFADLLATGDTARLAPLGTTRDGAPRAALPHLRVRPSRRPASALPAGDVAQVLGSAPAEAGAPSVPTLKVAVLNGNLTFIGQPLMVGHYKSVELTGTEDTVDLHIGGGMRMALALGTYPEAPGAYAIFRNARQEPDNPWRLPRPRAAIVIGLGEEGSLRAADLEFSVSQGAKGWAQRAAEETPGRGDGLEIAATLIGSGGIGIGAGVAARAIATGVRRANQRLANAGLPLIVRLTVVEWYLDRAADAWHGLRVLALAAPHDFEIAPTIASGTAPLRRQPAGGYRGTDYDLISVTAPSKGLISFALDTRRARSEVRAEQTQAGLVQRLVERAATARFSDPKLGSTLFKLLVPLELKPFLSGNDRLLLQLDRATAPIPWELLETDAADASDQQVDSAEPWSIRTRLLRKLLTGDFRNAPRDANAEASVLVIGEPKIDSPDYPPLPGARDEAKAVAQQFRSGPNALRDSQVEELTDAPEFDALMIALMARPYRVVHIAGHGALQTEDSRGGVVLSEGIYLGPDEIRKLPIVPELVFVNCCHLGAFDSNRTLKVSAPAAFAAGVAESLISIGVRCVVAAGWAVDDGPAKIFATRFYQMLLAGRPFVEAVVEARKAARAAAPSSKTWAAYQCYGDPNWVFNAAPADAEDDSAGPQRGVEVVASAPGLTLLLENLAVRSRYDLTRDAALSQTIRKQTQERLRRLEIDYGAMWAGMGAVAESFAVAWDAAGDRDQAIGWYERALGANDSSASLKTQEQLGNLRVRRAWSRISAIAAPATEAIDEVRDEITKAVHELETLAAVYPTMERLSICASAWKRLGQLETRAGHTGPASRALEKASKAYEKAEKLAIESGDPQLFYPGLNRMAIDWVRNAGHLRWTGFDAAAAARVEASLRTKHEIDPDFWTNAGLIEIEVLRALAARDLVKDGERFLKGYADLHERVGARGYWSSVADQARFTLMPFIVRTRGAQRNMAEKLFERLEGYVGRVVS